MLPLPTARAYIAFAGCVLIFVLGLWFQSPDIAILGSGGLIGMALCLSLTVPIAQRLRGQRVSFSWTARHEKVSHEPAMTRVGSAIDLACEFHNPSAWPVRFLELAPVMPPALSLLSCPSMITTPQSSRCHFTMRISGLATGTQVLQGLSVLVPGPLGLFAAPLYFPTVLSLRVLPAAPRPLPPLATSLGSAVAPSIERRMRQRSHEGHELRELRELQPGDPFKSIAWKPSARRGKLLVRQLEQPQQTTCVVVIDGSYAMRRGIPGERPLDHAVEIASLLATDALQQGDRTSLITVDGRIIEHAPEGHGLAHMARIHDALLSTMQPVDADLTEANADDVRNAVARYLRKQEGPLTLDESDDSQPFLVQRARLALAHEPASQRTSPPVAEDEADAYLRRFCRLRGISLPYREHTRAFAKGHGYSVALRVGAGRDRATKTIFLLCNPIDLPSLEDVQSGLRVLRSQGHALVVAVPSGFASVPQEPAERAHVFVDRLAEQRMLRNVRRFFGRYAVPVIDFRAGQSPAQSAWKMLGARERAQSWRRSA